MNARRCIVYPRGAPVFVATDEHLVPAEVLEDDGVEHPLVRLALTGDQIRVAASWLSLRRGPPKPASGGPGRDVPPLRFPPEGLRGDVISLEESLRRREREREERRRVPSPGKVRW